ncbi:hypothetical protein U1Q18_018922 [Sarracenia purpurea var. burkii]
MGRELLMVENRSIHPILSLSLLIACMAAIVTLISSLCVFRKKSPPPTSSQREKTEDLTGGVNPPPNETTMEPPSAPVVQPKDTKDTSQSSDPEDPQLPLPPPPGMAHLRGAASYHYRTESSASGRNFSSSMSMRVQGGLGGVVAAAFRQPSRREEVQQDRKRDKKLKHEDSIWKKTIILGEKCRVPDEDEDDAVMYDEKGNRISAYHRKTQSSLPVSRQTSFIDPNAIPTSAAQK